VTKKQILGALNFLKKEILFLLVLLLIEALIAASTIISAVPMTDFFLGHSSDQFSKITIYIIEINKNTGLPTNIYFFGLFFILTNFFKGLADIAITYYNNQIKHNILKRFYKIFLNEIFNARWRFFQTQSHGSLMSMMTKEMSNFGETSSSIAIIISNAVQILIYMIIPLMININITISIIACLVIISIPFFIFNKLNYNLSRQTIETSQAYLEFIDEIFRSAKAIKGFGKQKWATDRFMSLFETHVNAQRSFEIYNFALPRLFQPLSIAILISAILLSHEWGQSLSELSGILWSFFGIMPLFFAAIRTKISLNNFIPSFERIQNMRALAIGNREPIADKLFQDLHHDIALEDVTFRYPSGNILFEHFSIQFMKGETTAIVGISGAGKSTVIDLIMGLQEPIIGAIKYDGVNINSYSLESVRQKIGYVSQDILLFNGSVRDNLTWYSDKTSEGQIWEALKLAKLDDFIGGLPQGLNTLIGDRGMALSGGQRQRLALARALVSKPSILILDEATSALDSETELFIRNTLNDLSSQLTIIIVAHRISTIETADKIYVIDEGKIVESGTYTVIAGDQQSIFYKRFLKPSID